MQNCKSGQRIFWIIKPLKKKKKKRTSNPRKPEGPKDCQCVKEMFEQHKAARGKK